MLTLREKWHKVDEREHASGTGFEFHKGCDVHKITSFLRWSMACIIIWAAICASAHAQSQQSIKNIFTSENRNQLVMDIEAAIAMAQAQEGVIPEAAAREIMLKADIKYAPLDDISLEYKRVNHRMVALLNVWKRNLGPEAANALHFGVTTVDIYDTVRVLQIRDTINVLISDMREVEQMLIDLAVEHRDTVMVGRTLGQHALPITFGKKVAVWAAENRRNIERLKQVLDRIERTGVLKGAVGTHLGLGPRAIDVERNVSRRLELQALSPADWHGSRDVFAEYGQVLALISKSYANMGGEIFRLQMTDIAEVQEVLPSSNVGSSTMPHKRNPRKSESLVQHGRMIPRLADVLLDDVENVFERDNTSGPNRVLENISLEAGKMTRDARLLIGRLEISRAKMRSNLDRTDGMIMAQRVMLFLSDQIDRSVAEERVRDAAVISLDTDIPFSDALLMDKIIGPYLSGNLDRLLAPETYIGKSPEQVDRTIAHIKKMRRTD